MKAEHHYTFDAYYTSLPHEHAQWATSDRGWLYIDNVCYGHYLDYGPVRDGAPDVHAIVFERSSHSDQSYQTMNHRSMSCASVTEAQVWMLAQKETR